MMKIKLAKLALRISLIYVVVGIIWILFSGWALSALVSDPEVRARFEIYKGWGFVAVTALLLYLLLRGHLWQWEREATERKRAEGALRENENHLRAIIDAEPECVKVIGRDGRLLEINAAGLAMLEATSLAEVQQYPLLEFVVSEYRAAFTKLHQDVLNGQNGKLEFEIKGLHGTRRWLETHATPLRGASGTIHAILGVSRDVTNRKQAEEALRGSERLLRSVMDLVPHFIFVKDKQSRHLLVNRACAEACKLTPEQMVGCSDLDLAPGSMLAEAYMKDDQDVIASGRPKFVPEEKLTDAHGRTRFLQTTKIPFPPSAISFPVAGNGEPAILGVAVDITERKKAEDALREHHAQLTEALQIARLAYWEYDVTNDQFTFNDQFYSVLRTTASREGGYTMSGVEYSKRFVHPDDRAMVRTESQKQLTTTDPNFTQQLDHRIIYGDGEVGYFSVHVRVEKDAQGRTVRTHGANMDITERKRAELQVVESRNYLSKVINSITDPIFVKDRQHRWVLLNEAFCDFMGRQRSELLRKSDCDFFPKHEADVFWAKDELVFSTGKENINEEKFTDGKGMVRTILTKKVLYTDDKGEQFILGIIRDITERTHAEQTLQMFQFSIDQASDAIFWITQDAGFSYVNDQACRSLGYTREELMQLRLWDIDPAFSKERWETEWKRFLENKQGGTQQVESSHRRKNGSTFLVSVSTKHLRFGDTELHVAVARDISERRQAEEKLAYEQALFQTLLESAPDNIYFKDRESGFVRFSWSKAEDTLRTVRDNYRVAHPEVAPDQWPPHLAGPEPFARWLVGKTDFDTYPDAHARDAFEDEQEIIRTGRPLIGKLEKAILPDGKDIWWLTTKLPWHDKDKNIIGTFGVSKDVTELKEAEAALNRERLMLQTLVDNIPDRIYMKNAQSQFLKCNLAVARRLGVKDPALIIGKKDSDFYPPEKAREYYEDEQQIMQAGQALIDKIEALKGEDGLMTWASVTKIPLWDEQNKIAGLVGISRDITRQKQAEEELRQLNRSLQTLSKCNEALVRAVDESGLLAKICQTITETGGYRLAWVGYAEQDEARSVRPIAWAGAEEGYIKKLQVTWADTERGHGPAGTAIRTGQPSTFQRLTEDTNFAPWREEALRRGYAACIGLPLKADDKTFGVICVYSSKPDAFTATETALLTELAGDLAFGIATLRDRAGRKQLEEQLRQSQKMDAIGQLAGGVAHDFNNMLTVIQGNASMLLNPQLIAEERTRTDSAQQIVRAAERAAGLTRQLLVFSRKQVMQAVPLNLNEVVGNMTKMLQRILGEDISLNATYAGNLPVILADPGMIEQILLNLAVNSRDAMSNGGRLTISTSVETLDKKDAKKRPGAAPGLYACLNVTDTGCGIAPDILPHIFEPFFTTKEAGKGTGLGLATVYGIIQQHHGWITVDSRTGQGTSFRICLPAAKDLPSKSSAASVASKLPGGNETILLVEDEPPVRLLASNLLQRCGYTVLAAESGVAALPLWKEHREKIQLLLTDMVMPEGISGRDLAEKLKADRPELRIIYTSGYSTEVVGKEPPLIEGRNFLQKPYHPLKLAQIVRDSLNQNGGTS